MLGASALTCFSQVLYPAFVLNIWPDEEEGGDAEVQWAVLLFEDFGIGETGDLGVADYTDLVAPDAI